MGTNYFLISKPDKDNQDRLNYLKSQLSELANQATLFINKELTDSLQVSIDALTISETIHIGKNSHGWRFVFQGKNFLGLEHFEHSISQKYSNYIIQDEYQREISLDELVSIIKSSKNNAKKNPDDYKDYSNDGFPLLFCEFS